MKRTYYQPTPDLAVSEMIYKTGIDGLWFIQHQRFEDSRGLYAELALLPDLNDVIGYEFLIKQINMSVSNTNVVRGIHAEKWNKLVTTCGEQVMCALVDLRSESSSYKHVEYFLFGTAEDELKGSLFISQGIGNSLCVTKGPVEYLYCVDQLYRERDTSYDRAVSVFDPELAIEWPIEREAMILSERDRNAISIAEL